MRLTENGVAARLKSNRGIARSRQLKWEASSAERILWRELRGIEGGRFRRQAPFGPYNVDFASHAWKLIIEVDGPGHQMTGQPERDAIRQAWLEGRGYRVLRFSNGEVKTNAAAVRDRIIAYAVDSTPPPSPPRKGEGSNREGHQ